MAYLMGTAVRVMIIRTIVLLAAILAAYGGFSLFFEFGAADGIDVMDFVRSGLIFASTFWLA